MDSCTGRIRGAQPTVSFVLATHNRRPVLLKTIEKLLADRRPSCPFEVIVVDNASRDGTAEAVQRAHPVVTVLRRRRNAGSCAKAYGADRARGGFIVFLDDDSYPTCGSIDRMLGHFRRRPDLGAAGFRVLLPNGDEECSAFPNVFIGCGVGFRAAALSEVGGLDRTLFMAAEEYDLSFRLVQAGWHVETFDDIHVHHLKTAQGRRGPRPVYYDTRNNLLVAARYLPDPLYDEVRRDWMQRYRWLAGSEGRLATHLRASAAGRITALRNRRTHARWRLGSQAVQTLFRFDQVAERMRAIASAGVRRVVFADFGKNMLAFFRAAKAANVDVAAIADDRFHAPGRRYRGIPILPTEEARSLDTDAVVVSNTSPVHAARTERRLHELAVSPTHAWFAAGPIRAGNDDNGHGDHPSKLGGVLVDRTMTAVT